MKPVTLFGAALAGLALGLPISLPITGLHADQEESEYGVLVVADGVEETYYSCVACHSERIVAQQGLTRERWEKLLVWMVEEQGMPELDPETETIVLDYLAQHYNVDRPNFPAPAN